MKSIQQIKDDEAIKLGYNSFKDLYLNPKKDMGYQHLQWCVDAVVAAYTIGREEDKWIDVNDRLPENRCYVIAYTTNGGYTSTAEYKHGCFFKDLDRLYFVTHWQESPTPPKQR